MAASQLLPVTREQVDQLPTFHDPVRSRRVASRKTYWGFSFRAVMATAIAVVLLTTIALEAAWLGRGKIREAVSLFKADSGWAETDYTVVEQLDPKLLPAVGTKDVAPRRLVIVGDVHGCKVELEELLHKVKFNAANDHLIFVGDIIAKGPDTAGVIELARSLKASAVRGNHEDKLFAELARARRRGKAKTHGSTSAKALAHTLSDKHMKWLSKLPIILHLGELPGINAGQTVVVHGGLEPGKPLPWQDPQTCMNMRAINKQTLVPSADRDDGSPWYDIWNEAQKKLPRDKRTFVFYGHDAKTGLKENTYSLGLDSSCVKGNELSAAVVTAGKGSKVKIVSVRCKERYGYAD